MQNISSILKSFIVYEYKPNFLEPEFETKTFGSTNYASLSLKLLNWLNAKMVNHNETIWFYFLYFMLPMLAVVHLLQAKKQTFHLIYFSQTDYTSSRE